MTRVKFDGYAAKHAIEDLQRTLDELAELNERASNEHNSLTRKRITQKAQEKIQRAYALTNGLERLRVRSQKYRLKKQ